MILKKKLINFYEYLDKLKINFLNIEQYLDTGIDIYASKKGIDQPLNWFFNKVLILISLEKKDIFYYEAEALLR